MALRIGTSKSRNGWESNFCDTRLRIPRFFPLPNCIGYVLGREGFAATDTAVAAGNDCLLDVFKRRLPASGLDRIADMAQ